MEPEDRAPREPTTVPELLALHELAQYADAFDEEGWDSLKQLLEIDEAGLQQLAADVKMKKAHILRLRSALGKAEPYGPSYSKRFHSGILG